MQKSRVVVRARTTSKKSEILSKSSWKSGAFKRKQCVLVTFKAKVMNQVKAAA